MFYKRAFAEAWPNREIVQRLVALLPWGHNLVLLDKIKSDTDRITYAQLAIKNGWSRNVLVHQVEMKVADRQVKSKTDEKTIGLVLCKSRNDIVAEYALSDMKRPMGVSTYQLGLPSLDLLQEKLQKVLVVPQKKGGRK